MIQWCILWWLYVGPYFVAEFENEPDCQQAQLVLRAHGVNDTSCKMREPIECQKCEEKK